MRSAGKRTALVVAAAVALPVLVAAPAAAASGVTITSGTVSLAQKDPRAAIDPQRFIDVVIQVICPADQTREARVTVEQSRASGSNGSGSITCTGSPQIFVVTVQTTGSAGWRPGNALAVAEILEPALETSRQIRIRVGR